MSEATLDLAVTYLALVAVLAVLAAIGLRCGPAVRTGVIVAEALLIGLAAIDLLGIARGHRPPEPATHLGYVAVSVLLIPLLVGRPGRSQTGPSRRDTATDHVVTALACGVAIVVVVRLHATR